MAQRNVGNVEPQRGRPVTAHDAAVANQMFEMFLGASTLKTILGSYRYICECIHLKPNVLPQFYPKLKANLTSWRAKALWKKFDLRANQKCYGKGKLCPNTRVLIIGAGPCGLRTAIEAQLLGAKVVVVEKRDRMSRNNVLHLWPFVIDDLRSLGAKKFFGKFCAGAIDHISIRQIQCILLKVALLLGVEVHTEVSFERLIEPNPSEKTGWRAECKPAEHPVSQFEFDVIIGADGKRNTLRGFKRKEFRGRLAIAITANFINKRTEAEARVEEISGVAFIFNQKFFKDLYEETGIDLENIVYYKDDTHYFVMTAKKPSLIDKRVIKQDLPDTARLLAPDNVDRDALMNYAREAAEFSTNYNMLDLEFALNHYGQPDVAMFDFTSMYAAENASRVLERHGYKLLTILVGDSLLEPFWPTGSGCARGFLSSLDAGWAIRSYGSGMLTPLEVLAERESIYRLLAQTTPENLNKDYKGYTLEPSTRYPNLNKNLVLPQQVLSLYDTDDPKSLELQTAKTQINNTQELSKKRRRRDSHVDPDTLLVWIKEQVKEHEDLIVDDITTSFRDGRVMCAIISHYRPDLLDYTTIDLEDVERNNQIAFDILEKEIGIPPVMTGEDMVSEDGPDFLTMLSYLTQIYDVFRCEIPHIKHPKLMIRPGKQSEKSKFSLVNRQVTSNQPRLSVEDLNLTPIKSLEDYPPNTEKVEVEDKRPNADKVEVASSKESEKTKPLNAKISNRDLDGGRIIKRPKRIQEIIHKNLNVITKSAYLIESKILQDKIDAALKNNYGRKRRIRGKKKVAEKEKAKNEEDCKVLFVKNFGENEESEVGIEVKHKRDVCYCCERNKENFINKINDMKLDKVVLRDEESVKEIVYNPLTNCVNIVFPRIIQTLRYGLGINQVFGGKTSKHRSPVKRHNVDNIGLKKFLSLAKMSRSESKNMLQQAEQTFDRVVKWISVSDFNMRSCTDSPRTSSVQIDGLTDITSVTRQNKIANDDIIVEKLTEVMKFNSDGTQNICKGKREKESTSMESITKFLEELKNGEKVSKRFSHCPSNKLYERRIRSRSEPPGIFSVIVENEENELPEVLKRTELPFNKNHPAIKLQSSTTIPTNAAAPSVQHSRPSSRHKRHVGDPPPALMAKLSATPTERKQKKRRTMEKMSLAHMFLKEMFAIIWETSFIGLALFGLDLLINSESYGLPATLF